MHSSAGAGGGGNSGNGRPPAVMSARQLLRQQRELDERRKFGLAPLAVDSVTHEELSPNVPQTLAQAPWFYGASGPTLAHQRQRDVERNDVIEDKRDEVIVHAAATHYVAGACKNCGARTHKTHECTQAKKKVGAVYTNRVTGHDVTVTRVARNYAQKRDRYAGDVGVDLLRGYHDDDGDDDDTKKKDDNTTKHDDDTTTTQATRRRVDDDDDDGGVFASRTAQHGGVEIKELPKYLQSLDASDATFFDHRTGSMRANPNAHDATRTFRGDLERYRSGDYYNYVETQYRFLTGQSASFVDFAYDEQMRRAREGAEQPQASSTTTSGATTTASGDDEATRRTRDDIVLRALHADATTTTTMTRHSSNDDDDGVTRQSSPPPPIRDDDAAIPAAAADDARATMSSEQQQLLQLSLLPVATYHGHRLPYGSYFDATTFAWGYGCCRRLGKKAPSCIQ